MSGGWNNGPVRTPSEHIDCFVDFMREFLVAVLGILIIAGIVDWLWIAG